MTRILILTGEASGDEHGSRLAAELRRQEPGIELLGLGGNRMQAAGVELLAGIDRLDIIGIPSFAEARQALLMFRALSRRIAELELDAVVLIDNPGLNLRLAEVAKRSGHRVIYFVAPQIWAWHASRIKKLKRFVDLVLVILPFEPEIYAKAGVRHQFVGHPLLDAIPLERDQLAARKNIGLEPNASVVGMLPGSRKSEMRLLLPTMLEAARRLASEQAGERAPLRFVLGQAPTLPDALLHEILATSQVPVVIAKGQAFDVMAASDALIVASGTATLQSAVVGTPMTIVYRGSALTALLARHVVRVPWLGLANLVAGRLIATELIQNDFTPERLAAEVGRNLTDPQAQERARANARELRAKFGTPEAAKRAAEAILAEAKSAR